MPKRTGTSYFETDGDEPVVVVPKSAAKQRTPAQESRRSTSKRPNPSQHNNACYFQIHGDDQSHTIRSKYTEDTAESSVDSSVLTWRGTPETTGAEIPIVLLAQDRQDAITYHVHREVLLSRNSRQCQYFSSVLQRKEQSRSSRKGVRHQRPPSIKIELSREQDVENFPILLDFMYSNSTQLNFAGGYQDNRMRGNQCIHRRTPERYAPTTTPVRSVREDGLVSLSSFTTASSHSVLRSMSEDSEDTSYHAFIRNNISTSNAVSIRSLALQFDNKALLRGVNTFIQKDLGIRTVSKYMSNAVEYNDQRLLDAAKRLFLDNFDEVDPKYIVRLPLKLFRSLVKTFESLDGDENSRYSQQLSIIVCKYLEKHPEEQSIELLLELTDSLIMPLIAPEAAMGFTAIVKSLDVTDSNKIYWPRLVRFCQRCSREAVNEYGWNDFCVEAAVQEYVAKLLSDRDTKPQQHKQLPDPAPIDSLLFATSFAAALEQAQDDYEEISTAHEELDSMVSLLDQSASQWEALSQSQEKYIEKQKKALVTARSEIADLQTQVEELERKLHSEQQQKLQSKAEHGSLPPTLPLMKRSQQRLQSQRKASHHAASIRDETATQLEIPEPETFPMKNLISPAQLGHLHALRHRRRQELKLRRNRRRSSLKNDNSNNNHDVDNLR